MTSPHPSHDQSDSMSEWVQDCIHWHGHPLTGTFGHWCAEWDYLPIDETCLEFGVCNCYRDDPEANKFREERGDEMARITEEYAASVFDDEVELEVRKYLEDEDYQPGNRPPWEDDEDDHTY